MDIVGLADGFESTKDAAPRAQSLHAGEILGRQQIRHVKESRSVGLQGLAVFATAARTVLKNVHVKKCVGTRLIVHVNRFGPLRIARTVDNFGLSPNHVGSGGAASG